MCSYNSYGRGKVYYCYGGGGGGGGGGGEEEGRGGKYLIEGDLPFECC